MSENEYYKYTSSSIKARQDSLVIFDLESIEIGQDAFSIRGISPYLYGRFFNDRASFYVIDQFPISLNNNVYNSTMVLFFLDCFLLKKKYHLTEDVLNDFVSHYQTSVPRKEWYPHISDLKEQRFFTLKFRNDKLNVVIRKTDNAEYSIEEYHPYYPALLNSVQAETILPQLN